MYDLALYIGPKSVALYSDADLYIFNWDVSEEGW